MTWHKHTQPNTAGFTIVELMVATLVFSVILVVITSGVIHFTTDYYKGINSSATQTAARNVANTIAHNLQYGGGRGSLGAATPAANDYAYCIGTTQVDYNLGGQLGTTGNNYGAFVTTAPTGGGCSLYTASMSGNELLGTNMRLTNLDITPVTSGTSNLYKISVGVAYGDIDLLCSRLIPSGNAGSCSPSATTANGDISWGTVVSGVTVGSAVHCKSGKGSQFCAVAHLTTEVVSRFD